MLKKSTAFLILAFAFTSLVRLPVAAAETAEKPVVRTLGDMVKAGHYDRVHYNIRSEVFSVDATRWNACEPQQGNLFRDPNGVFNDATVVMLDKGGYRPATLEELLAYGAEAPDQQRTKTIVALGTWYGHAGGKFYVELTGSKTNREVKPAGWHENDERWPATTWFLFFKK